eukprot:1853519-Pyramimonas_sp.AAC.2
MFLCCADRVCASRLAVALVRRRPSAQKVPDGHERAPHHHHHHHHHLHHHHHHHPHPHRRDTINISINTIGPPSSKPSSSPHHRPHHQHHHPDTIIVIIIINVSIIGTPSSSS